MLFNSYSFIFIFLPLTFLIYFLLNSKGLYFYSKTFIALASLVFYSWWNIIYLPLLLLSITFNFTIGIMLSNKTEKNYKKKLLLVLGIITNLLLLGYFKYMDFFIENYNSITDSNFPLLEITLLLAISFFTF